MSSSKKNVRTKRRRTRRKRSLKKKKDEKKHAEITNLLPETIEGQIRLPIKMTEGWYCINYDETPVVEEKSFFNFFRL